MRFFLSLMLTLLLLTSYAYSENEVEYLNDCIANRKEANFQYMSIPDAQLLSQQLSLYNRATIEGLWIKQSGTTITIGSYGYRTTDEEEAVVDKGIQLWAKYTKTTDPEEICKRIVYFIANRVRYDDSIEHCFDTYGAYYNRRAVCQGYALLAKKMLDIKNIKNELISENDHMYNKVIINGEEHFMDITKWDEMTTDILPTLRDLLPWDYIVK